MSVYAHDDRSPRSKSWQNGREKQVHRITSELQYLSQVMRTSRHKVGKDRKNLNNTINQLDLTDSKKKNP